jgi:hypothetical protein
MWEDVREEPSPDDSQANWYDEEFGSNPERHVVEYLSKKDTTWPKAHQIAEYESDASISPSKGNVTHAINVLADKLYLGGDVWWNEPGETVNGDLLRHEFDRRLEESDMDPELDYTDVR